ncbi:GNAT family N-acetyltransferase [Streptomyces sp. NPDC015130]|uniref:GNAT family N-acetyltransferase n=1 Tax=Streptomyces sp. NPDC015130 TaxID=3364940 RepID=UPI0036F5A7CE
MSAPVVLQVAALLVSPAFVLRPWLMEDVAAWVELSRDPALSQSASSVVDNDADGTRWVQAQQQRRAAGDRYAVFEAQPGSVRAQLVGNGVLKEVTCGKPAGAVGCWTAVHARGRGVASRALEALPSWAFDTIDTFDTFGIFEAAGDDRA